MRLWLLVVVSWLSTALVAQASGPVERLVQVLLHPSDPSIVVVRWGVASEGYLFSRDGGKTFAALCSAAITPLAGVAGVSPISRLSSLAVNGNAATLLDGQGHLHATQLNGLWSDDGTGCAWSHGLIGGWPTALQLDPATGELLAVVNVSSGTDDDREVRALSLRRDASGTWTSFDQGGALIAHVPGQQALGGELKVAGARLYATVLVSQGSAPEQALHVVRSDDGGKTWTAGPALPAQQAETFTLVAVDPNDPQRLLAALSDDVAADVLLLSEDEGASFQPYGQLRALTGVAFAPDGAVYVTDQGDAADVGGLWTAPRLGQPLRKVEGTAGLDCVTWSAAKTGFYLCQGDRVRLFDPGSAKFEDVVRISEVSGLLSCTGADVGAVCQDQLNMGASWCCTGHYPCTPFCTMYDVTMRGNERVFCGKSGLAQDLMSGRSCDEQGDAGTTDAGKVADPTPRKRDDGCAIDARAGGFGGLALFLMVVGQNRRRGKVGRG